MSRFLLSARAVGPPSFPLDPVLLEGHGWNSSLCSLQRHSSSPRGIYCTGQLSRGALFAGVGRGRAWDGVGLNVTPSFVFFLPDHFLVHPGLCSHNLSFSSSSHHFLPGRLTCLVHPRLHSAFQLSVLQCRPTLCLVPHHPSP